MKEYTSQTGFTSQLELHDVPPELNKPSSPQQKKVGALLLGVVLLVVGITLLAVILKPDPPPPPASIEPSPTALPRSTGIKLEFEQAEHFLNAADPNTVLQPPPAVDMKTTF